MTTITPEVTHGIVNRVQNSIFGYQGWPSIARDENGTIYVVSSSFRTQHICPFGKTAMYISKNNGKTFSPPIVINDTYLDDRDAGILYLGNGRLLVTWFSHPIEVYLNRYYNSIKNSAAPLEAPATIGTLSTYPNIPAEHATGGSFIRISEDYGMTWSDTIKLPISSPHGPNVLHDGTLIYLGKEMYSDEVSKGSICSFKSTDGGYTWEKQCELPFAPDMPAGQVHEPHVIELTDGRLLGMIRAHRPNGGHFTCYQTISADGGNTWSVPAPTGFEGSPPHLFRHSSGALICAIGRRIPPYGERAVVSWDDGATWEEEYILDERADGGDLGYPATIELDDGSLMTIYYQRFPGDAKCSILYTIWRLKER